MACAVVRILDEILLDHPDLSEITLWSGSCVSQNNNSLMTIALTALIKKHPNLKIIIQEVDNVHCYRVTSEASGDVQPCWPVEKTEHHKKLQSHPGERCFLLLHSCKTGVQF